MTNRKVLAKDKKIQLKKKRKYPVIICLLLGFGVGWFTEFNIKDFIESISKYKIVVVKDKVQEEEEKQESDTMVEETSEAEVVKENITKINKNSTEDKIGKAKQAIINQCGSDFSEVVYSGEAQHPTTRKGKYYVFCIGEDVTGDMMLYVDKNTYQVYEYSVDGYFGKLRDGYSDVFTYDMAIMKLNNYLEWDEDRRFHLNEETSDGFIITTYFDAPGGTGKGDTFYVTRDDVDYYNYQENF